MFINRNNEIGQPVGCKGNQMSPYPAWGLHSTSTPFSNADSLPLAQCDLGDASFTDSLE